MARTPSILWCTGLVAFLSPSVTCAQGPHEALQLDAKIVLTAYAGLVEEHLLGVVNGALGTSISATALAQRVADRIRLPGNARERALRAIQIHGMGLCLGNHRR